MAITPDEQQSIVSAVLSSIRTNSRTIDQLTPVTSLSDSDSFEINGGKRVTYKVLRDLIEILFTTAIDTLKTNIKNADKSLSARIDLEAKTRETVDGELKILIDRLRRDFDTLCGENASDAIDNFNEIIAFLDGITDSETLAAKFADLAMQNAGINRQLSSLERKTAPIIVCDETLEYYQIPTRPGVFLQRDDEGDIVQIVESGTELVRSLPVEGKFYMCGELLYMFNGITLEPVGQRHLVFDGGAADTVFSDSIPVIGGGEPNSDFTIAKVYDGGEARQKF